MVHSLRDLHEGMSLAEYLSSCSLAVLPLLVALLNLFIGVQIVASLVLHHVTFLLRLFLVVARGTLLHCCPLRLLRSHKPISADSS